MSNRKKSGSVNKIDEQTRTSNTRSNSTTSRKSGSTNSKQNIGPNKEKEIKFNISRLTKDYTPLKLDNSKKKYDDFINIVCGKSEHIKNYFKAYISLLKENNSYFLYNINSEDPINYQNAINFLNTNFNKPFNERDYNTFANTLNIASNSPNKSLDPLAILKNYVLIDKTGTNDILSSLLLSLLIIDSKSNTYPLNLTLTQDYYIKLVEFGKIYKTVYSNMNLINFIDLGIYKFISTCYISGINGILLYNIFGNNIFSNVIVDGNKADKNNIIIDSNKVKEIIKDQNRAKDIIDNIPIFRNTFNIYTLDATLFNYTNSKNLENIINMFFNTSYDLKHICKTCDALILDYGPRSKRANPSTDINVGIAYNNLIFYLNFLYYDHSNKLTSILSTLIQNSYINMLNSAANFVFSDEILKYYNINNHLIIYVFDLLCVILELLTTKAKLKTNYEADIFNLLYLENNLLCLLESNILINIFIIKKEERAQLFFEYLMQKIVSISMVRGEYSKKVIRLDKSLIFENNMIIVQKGIIDVYPTSTLNDFQMRSLINGNNKDEPITLKTIHDKVLKLETNSLNLFPYYLKKDSNETNNITCHTFIYNVILYNHPEIKKPYLNYLIDECIANTFTNNNLEMFLLKHILLTLNYYQKIVGCVFINQTGGSQIRQSFKSEYSNPYLINYAGSTDKYIKILLEIGFDILETRELDSEISGNDTNYNNHLKTILTQLIKQNNNITSSSLKDSMITIPSKKKIYFNILSIAYLISDNKKQFVQTVVDYYKSYDIIKAMTNVLYNIIYKTTGELLTCNNINNAVNQLNNIKKTSLNIYFTGKFNLINQQYIFIFEPLISINLSNRNNKSTSDLIGHLGITKCKLTVVMLICKTFSDTDECVDKISSPEIEKRISTYIKSNYILNINKYLNISVKYNEYVEYYNKTMTYDILFQNPLFFLSITSSVFLDTEKNKLMSKISSVISGLINLGASFDSPLITECDHEFINYINKQLGTRIRGTDITVRDMINIINSNTLKYTQLSNSPPAKDKGKEKIENPPPARNKLIGRFDSVDRLLQQYDIKVLINTLNTYVEYAKLTDLTKDEADDISFNISRLTETIKQYDLISILSSDLAKNHTNDELNQLIAYQNIILSRNDLSNEKRNDIDANIKKINRAIGKKKK